MSKKDETETTYAERAFSTLNSVLSSVRGMVQGTQDNVAPETFNSFRKSSDENNRKLHDQVIDLQKQLNESNETLKLTLQQLDKSNDMTTRATFVKAFKSLGNDISNDWDQVKKYIGDSRATQSMQSSKQKMQETLRIIVDFLNRTIQHLQKTLSEIKKGIVDKTSPYLQAASKSITDIFTKIIEGFRKLGKILSDFSNSLLRGLGNGLQNAGDKVKKAAEKREKPTEKHQLKIDIIKLAKGIREDMDEESREESRNESGPKNP